MKSFNKTMLTGAVGAALLAILAGCDDPSTPSKPTSKPIASVAASQPVETLAMVAAYPMRPQAIASIDGRDVLFPAAKLAVIDRKNGGITLRLCSDDPPAAIDPGYVGNSFVLDMRLAIDRLDEIPLSAWDYKPADVGDSNSGFFLHGYREQYRPADVHVTFQKAGDELLTYLSGTFLQSDTQNPAAAPERVQVIACLRTPMPNN